MTQDYNGDWITARQKINEGTDWRGTANVTVDGEAREIGFRLLNESEFLDLKRVIPLSDLQEYQDEDQSEAEERLQELQSKDELTDEEERELETLQAKVASMQDEIEDKLGQEAYDEILRAGKRAVMPTEGDVQDILDAPLDVQKQILHHVPDYMDFEAAEELLKQDMEQTIEDQPYPIKFTLGMQAFMESVKVLGNGLNREA